MSLGLHAHTCPTAHTLTHTHPTARLCVITPTPLPPPVAGAAGHLCCASCATAALPKPRQCPRCGGPCLGKPKASPAARFVIAAMGARCPGRCGWAGPLGALDAHWAQCRREAVTCAVAGCGTTVARGEMAAHIAGTPDGAAAPARPPATPPQPPFSAPSVTRAAAAPPPPATPTIPPSDGRACAHTRARGERACVYTCPL